MRLFLVEEFQKPRWSRPVKHIYASTAEEACSRFDYLCNFPDISLRAHELKRDESGELVGKEDCADCFEYLHNKEKYYCNTKGCNQGYVLLSRYDLNEGQINCEYCDKPLQVIRL